MADPNEELLRRGYEAFAAGDMATLNELLSDDIVWHVPGKSPIAGDYKGKDQVFGFFGKIVEMTGGNFKNEIHDLLANDEHGIVLVTTTADRGAKHLDDRQVHVFHLKDGRATEFWNHSGDQYALDEFWS
jgi:ketosteroid isomerase-like protein